MTGNVSWNNTGEIGNDYMDGYPLCVHIGSEKYFISCGTHPVSIETILPFS